MKVHTDRTTKYINPWFYVYYLHDLILASKIFKGQQRNEKPAVTPGRDVQGSKIKDGAVQIASGAHFGGKDMYAVQLRHTHIYIYR